jgi:hypothetical protein
VRSEVNTAAAPRAPASALVADDALFEQITFVTTPTPFLITPPTAEPAAAPAAAPLAVTAFTPSPSGDGPRAGPQLSAGAIEIREELRRAPSPSGVIKVPKGSAAALVPRGPGTDSEAVGRPPKKWESRGAAGGRPSVVFA